MIDLYSTLPKKNNHSASCERVAGRPTAAILDALPDLSMTRDGAFAGGLVRPHVLDTTLDDGYRAMAADKEREAEALEWCNALVGDIADEAR